MINIKKREECCGCNVCGDICPTSAITFYIDNEGFWYPKVNKEKCINCGLCEEVCPIKTECNSKKINTREPDCYAVEHKSIEVRFNSTTGGAFSAFAEEMYSQKGYVGGAIHNEDFSVSHFISNDRKDLQKLRRSKDLQSNAEGFYKKVKLLLDKKEKVLVCGLPCQIAGLYNFLNKNYENLITIDLICLGVNSPKVWDKYIKYIEKINNSKIILTENKSKEYGWDKLTQKFIFENGKEYFDTDKTSLFIRGYVGSHLYCRPSCYECKFKGFPRIADITIGDFWGITKYTQKHNSNMGTNLLMINSEKGNEYFNKIKKRINFEKTPLKWGVSGNPALISSVSRMFSNDERKEFFSDVEKLSFYETITKYEKMKKSRIKDKLKQIKKRLIFFRKIIQVTRMQPRALYQTIKYSGIKNLLKNRGIICGTNCHLKIDKTAQVNIGGLFIFGSKNKFPKSNLESRLFIGKNGKLEILGEFEVESNCEIVIFNNAELVIHGSKLSYSDANTGLRIVCGEKIEIMSDVGIGRNVMIRDTNGNHYMNTIGYKPTRPIVIGEKAWLCESCTIMPGVKIGRSGIVGAHSVVIRTVPPHSLVLGNPAEIIQKNILFKL